MNLDSEMAQLANDLSGYIVRLSDFEIRNQIGKGGFSDVFLGKQHKTGMLCAIKILKVRNLDRDNFVIYKREVGILASGKNRFLLNFIGFTTTYPFVIITEYVEKGTLYDSLHRKPGSPSLSGTQKTLIAMGIAYAMDRLHKIRVIHRDLKSLNILLDNQCLPKVIDFGLSRFRNENDSILTGDIGTPHWMAPELFESREYTNKVDVYSYGMVIWEMITGTYPFHDLTAVQIAYKVCKENARPEIPTRGVSPAIKKLIISCWSKSPEHRPTFKQIFNGFKQGKIQFFDTDPNAVKLLVNQLKSDRIKYKSDPSNKMINPKYNRQPSHLKPFNDVNAILDKPSIELEPLKNCSSQEFISILQQASGSITLMEGESFLKTIYARYQIDSNIAVKEEILYSTYRLFIRSKQFIKMFLDLKLNNVLSYRIIELQTRIFDILILIFQHTPQYVDEAMLLQITEMAAYHPLHTTRLINIYSCIHTGLPMFWKATDILFTKSNLFMTNGIETTDAYLRLLYTLSALFEDFRKNKINQLLKILASVIRKHSHVIILLAYNILNAITELETIEFSDVFYPLLNHLGNISYCEQASNVLIRLKFKNYPPTLIAAAIFAAKHKKIACCLLCKLCQSQSAAVTVASMNEDWLEPLPSLECTLQLLMTVLMHNQARDILINSEQFIRFLNSIIQVQEQQFFEALAPIIMCFEATTEFVSLLSELGFLRNYYSFAYSYRTSSNICNSILMSNKLCRVAFVNDFLILLPLLKELMSETQQGWQPYALVLLSTLSIHPAARETLQNSQFYEKILPFRNNPNLYQYAVVFMQNIVS